jgi:hypothetical protein
MEKAMGHKYIKREGATGNYKYTYATEVFRGAHHEDVDHHVQEATHHANALLPGGAAGAPNMNRYHAAMEQGHAAGAEGHGHHASGDHAAAQAAFDQAAKHFKAASKVGGDYGPTPHLKSGAKELGEDFGEAARQSGLRGESKGAEPSQSYAQYADALHQEAGKQGKKISFGPEAHDAWKEGVSPAEHVAKLPSARGEEGKTSDKPTSAKAAVHLSRAEAVYKEAAALVNAKSPSIAELERARVASITIGDLVLKAKKNGADPGKVRQARAAQEALLSAYHRKIGPLLKKPGPDESGPAEHGAKPPSGAGKAGKAKYGWEGKGDKLHGGKATVSYQNADGRNISRETNFRIDGRDGTFRVDRHESLGNHWEAIDGGKGFKTLGEAKAHVAKWHEAAEKQGTMTPKVEAAHEAKAGGSPGKPSGGEKKESALTPKDHETIKIVQNLGKLGLHVQQHPSGRFSFVGSVPKELSYVRKDGQPLTDQDVKDIKQSGPGFVSHVKARSFASRDEAYAAAKEAGLDLGAGGSAEDKPVGKPKQLNLFGKSLKGLAGLGDYLEKADRLPGGLADGKSPGDFDPKALAQGQAVEREHTDDPAKAREIAMDHLTEDPRYYSKLAIMEVKKSEVDDAIESFFQRNPHPDDHEVHALAGRLGLEHSKLEERIYAIAGKRLEKCGMAKAELTPQKARQILHDGTAQGRPVTAQQRKYFGAVASGDARKGMAKSMRTGLEVLSEYLTKSVDDPMPDNAYKLGYDKSAEFGGSPDGGDLRGKTLDFHGDRVGDAKGAAGTPADVGGKATVSGGPINGEERMPEKQMSPGKSPLEDEIHEKSLTPAGQRAMVAREHALKVQELTKSADVQVGTPDHPYMMSSMGDVDSATESLLKSEFYHGAEPTLAQPGTVIRAHVLCKSEACGVSYPAFYTACPDCGHGQTVNRLLPRSGHVGGKAGMVLEKSAYDPILRAVPGEDDVMVGERENPVVLRINRR